MAWLPSNSAIEVSAEPLGEEELAEIEGRITGIPSWHRGWMRYKADMLRLIAALRAIKIEAKRLSERLVSEGHWDEEKLCEWRKEWGINE